jgi:hypothetical protein
MKILFFMSRIIESLSKGKTLQQFFALVMKCLATLFVIFVLWQFFKSFDAFQGMEFGDKVALFVFGNLFSLLSGWVVFQVLWIRSEDIRKDESEEYKAIPISKYFLKALGEFYASVLLIASFSGMMLIWIMGRGGYGHMPFFPELIFQPDSRFLLGLSVFITAVVYSALVLFITYCIAELIGVWAEIAKNTRELKKNG